MIEQDNQIEKLVKESKTGKLSRKQKETLLALLQERERRRSLNNIEKIYNALYPWQKRFCYATQHYSSCLLMAANRVGKSWTGLLIDAIHATGRYPDTWEGHKFDHAPLLWILGYSGEKIRDILQIPLVGHYSNGELSGGLIPKERILKAYPMQGTSGAVREVQIAHKSGQRSRIQFWSYSQGQHALMGDSVDWYHIDEEPKDEKIHPQVITRTATGDKGRGGRGIMTFTPENGRTELVIKYMDNPGNSQYLQRATWDDAPHLNEETKEALLEQFPPWQRDMRSKGEPLLGTGIIFDLDISHNFVDPFKCPNHWHIINGMDFGWDHPQAHVQLWIDRDTDTIYVANAYKQSKQQPFETWEVVKSWCKNVPTAWPHDGLQTEKGSAKQQKSYYSDAGWAMLHKQAQWDDGSNGVEAGLMELHKLLKTRKLLFIKSAGINEMQEELLQYHRDEKGKIVKIKDDLIDALRYAYMMRRHAKTKYDIINADSYEDEYESSREFW